jgi:hypothetical protein
VIAGEAADENAGEIGADEALEALLSRTSTWLHQPLDAAAVGQEQAAAAQRCPERFLGRRAHA